MAAKSSSTAAKWKTPSTGPGTWGTPTLPLLPPANDPDRKGGQAATGCIGPNPPRMTYGNLKTIARILKQTGQRMTGKPVQMGATFDPGGEFAVSDFKFKRHKEIARLGTRGPNTWVDCTATFDADPRAYAGFPKGIPAGTPFGTFLGRQSQHFLTDLGFDYIWFSNGLGFPHNHGTSVDLCSTERFSMR